MMKNTILVLLIGFVLVAIQSCGDVGYEECTFSPRYVQECEPPNGEDNGVNCIITAHPECGSACIKYQNSEPFCSNTCETDADCHDGGLCIEFAKNCDNDGYNCDRYCVADFAL